ncbi:MAG: zinc-ribbon domain-containing protein [Azoarcus sp.]|jgi:hypothetical protein|nr:zinc-ribbon domain-containing protein [Azoarcus sp.]
MALIKCPECGNDVSTEAATCPKCGAPIKPAAPANLEADIKNKTNSVIQTVGALIFVGVVVAMCTSNDSDKEDKPAAKECAKDDLQCLGDKLTVAAGIRCKEPIERLAKHTMRWTDGTFGFKFSHFRWADKDAGHVTMIGDKAEFQNGFGAYTPVIYECDMDSEGKTVIDVRVREGRLPN